jgi:hypothetical protein
MKNTKLRAVSYRGPLFAFSNPLNCYIATALFFFFFPGGDPTWLFRDIGNTGVSTNSSLKTT